VSSSTGDTPCNNFWLSYCASSAGTGGAQGTGGTTSKSTGGTTAGTGGNTATGGTTSVTHSCADLKANCGNSTTCPTSTKSAADLYQCQQDALLDDEFTCNAVWGYFCI
jgi:hypothetical protein